MVDRRKNAIWLAGFLACICRRCVRSGRSLFLREKLPVKREVKPISKKIEQDTARKCLKSEYLTLLNSFRVLQDCDCRALGPAAGAWCCQPPKSFNEKELYGR